MRGWLLWFLLRALKKETVLLTEGMMEMELSNEMVVMRKP